MISEYELPVPAQIHTYGERNTNIHTNNTHIKIRIHEHNNKINRILLSITTITIIIVIP